MSGPLPGQIALPIFDLEAGRQARDEGMDRAEAAQGSTWSYFAFLTLQRLVSGALPTKVPGEIHADDLEAHLEWEPSSRNALGAVWQRAIREGLIEWTGQMRHSERKDAHARLCKVYRAGQGQGQRHVGIDAERLIRGSAVKGAE